MHIPFDNSYNTLPEAFFTRQIPTPVRAAQMLAWNAPLASDLGIEGAPDDRVFAGNTVPQGADPLAQLYGGHQFGSYAGQLGDGRAILLGESIGMDGKRRDIQLKGAGRTPYSRMGDGRAWLGPVLREYAVSEAMHALDIPSTRALAAVATGEPVLREEGALPGAVLTRVASSHLRVGTFEIFARRGQTEHLVRLTEYAIARHYPGTDGWAGLLRAVCNAQAQLIAAWMSVGFIHGVMNTDNCAISGETLDYGPCAFMDAYQEMQVFSFIDRGGRYAYANQARIAVWNMAQFATALIQQAKDVTSAADQATQIVHSMPAQLRTHWRARFGRKIGLANAAAHDEHLIEDLLRLMQRHTIDFTVFFRALIHDQAHSLFHDTHDFDDWRARWHARLAHEAAPDEIMARANPAIIPRNHQIELMITRAISGDMSHFERLTSALASPFTDNAEFSLPPECDEIVPATYCGT